MRPFVRNDEFRTPSRAVAAGTRRPWQSRQPHQETTIYSRVMPDRAPTSTTQEPPNSRGAPENGRPNRDYARAGTVTGSGLDRPGTDGMTRFADGSTSRIVRCESALSLFRGEERSARRSTRRPHGLCAATMSYVEPRAAETSPRTESSGVAVRWRVLKSTASRPTPWVRPPTMSKVSVNPQYW